MAAMCSIGNCEQKILSGLKSLWSREVALQTVLARTDSKKYTSHYNTNENAYVEQTKVANIMFTLLSAMPTDIFYCILFHFKSKS